MASASEIEQSAKKVVKLKEIRGRICLIPPVKVRSKTTGEELSIDMIAESGRVAVVEKGIWQDPDLFESTPSSGEEKRHESSHRNARV